MFLRNSGRLNPDCTSDSKEESPLTQAINPYFVGYSSQASQDQQELEQHQVKQTRYFNSPTIHKLVEETNNFVYGKKVYKVKSELKRPTESTIKSSSATTKALGQLELEADKKKWKKAEKISVALKRKKLNQRLSKILAPKSALNLLHELKPGCSYKFEEKTDCVPPSYIVQVNLNGEVLGTGQGSSKTQAKNFAAEDAIKTIVSKVLSHNLENKDQRGAEGDEEKEDKREDLPWAGLASFAIYKMFNEWQRQGTDVFSVVKHPGKKKFPSVNSPTKKDLPANANQLHPSVVLNMVNPGLTPIELERNDTPKCRVKIAYVIDGKMFCGVGGNKKDARKEAAKAVLEGLYGLTYS